MSLQVKEQIVLAGIVPTFWAATAGGDEFVNSGNIIIHAKNANGGATRTITVDAPNNCSLAYAHDVTIVVPISGERISGVFPKAWFNDTDGRVQITYDNEADLTIAILELP